MFKIKLYLAVFFGVIFSAACLNAVENEFLHSKPKDASVNKKDFVSTNKEQRIQNMKKIIGITAFASGVLAIGSGIWIYKNSGSTGLEITEECNNCIAACLREIKRYEGLKPDKRWFEILANLVNNFKEWSANRWILDKNADNEIRFYEQSMPYYEFTNFYPKTSGRFDHLLIDGVEWASSETYFHHQKFTHLKSNPIQCDMSADQALAAANEMGSVIHKEWFVNKINISVMYYVLLHKFSQNPYLMQLLINTSDKRIVEFNTSKDPKKKAENFWAYSSDEGNGFNCLGRILMQIRGLK